MIGIDLDNTIISYGEAFPKAARRLGLDRFGGIPATKHEIRQWLQSMNRNDVWTELQGCVYGAGMEHARPFPGVLECLRTWRLASVEICIISHKSVFPALGSRWNLREAAMTWLASAGFFNHKDGGGLDSEDVFFADNRNQKVARIAQMECRCFIDDLPEVFADPGFPPGTERCLFDPDAVHPDWAGGKRCRSWSEIREWMTHFRRCL